MNIEFQRLIRGLAGEIASSPYPGKTQAVETLLTRLIEYLPPAPPAEVETEAPSVDWQDVSRKAHQSPDGQMIGAIAPPPPPVDAPRRMKANLHSDIGSYHHKEHDYIYTCDRAIRCQPVDQQPAPARTAEPVGRSWIVREAKSVLTNGVLTLRGGRIPLEDVRELTADEIKALEASR